MSIIVPLLRLGGCFTKSKRKQIFNKLWQSSQPELITFVMSSPSFMQAFNRLKNLLFLDVETASAFPEFESLDDRLKTLWEKKAKRWNAEAKSSTLYKEKAALLPEFGKVVTIGLGYFHLDDQNEMTFRVTALTQETEKDLLIDFKKLVEENFKANDILFVAHGGKEFDYPYLCRRMVVQGITLPQVLNLYGKRPWQIPHLDTMELWRFGDPKTYVSLEMLAALFRLPSSKTNLNGSQVSEVYHNDHNLSRIAEYCMEDVVLTARIYLRMLSFPDIKTENIYKV